MGLLTSSKLRKDSDMATEQAEVLEWSEAPPVKRGTRGSKYDGIIAQLKANPGKEAKVMSDVNSASARIFRENGLTVKTRSTGNGRKVDVWAVWEGEAVEAEDDSTTDDAPKSPARKRTKKAPAAKKTATRPRASKSKS